MESDVVEVKETPISVLSTSRPISSEMWPDHCPGPLGLKCDCFVQYCTLLVIIMMCLLLGGVGIGAWHSIVYRVVDADLSHDRCTIINLA